MRALYPFVEAFLTSLSKREGMEGVQVDYYWPGENAQPILVWFDDADSIMAEPRMSGNRPLVTEETFKACFIAEARLEGKSPKDAMEALHAVVSEFIAECDENKRYTTTENDICIVRFDGWKMRNWVTKYERGASARLEIKVTARRKTP